MGITIVLGTLTLFLCYWPDRGAMLCRAGRLAYDPQLIKPPEGYKGSDERVDGHAHSAVKPPPVGMPSAPQVV